MEELYILGNGFDLYLGLKTKYSDYFKNRKISEEFFEKIKLIFKNSIGSYNYDARGKVYAVFDYNETLLNMQIIQLYKDIEKNLFYLYLKNKYHNNQINFENMNNLLLTKNVQKN